MPVRTVDLTSMEPSTTPAQRVRAGFRKFSYCKFSPCMAPGWRARAGLTGPRPDLTRPDVALASDVVLGGIIEHQKSDFVKA